MPKKKEIVQKDFNFKEVALVTLNQENRHKKLFEL